MSELNASQRKRLPDNIFGLPGLRKYPVDTKARAANAKARASQQVGKSISASQKATIDAKANKVLGK